MALGGGTFVAQNKALPGAYINFVSLSGASATLSDRGIAAIGLEMDWGESGSVIKITSEDFQKKSLNIFGYSFDSDNLKNVREIFKNIHTLYAFRLNGGGAKAANTFATAKCAGVRGNDLTIVISKNVDNENAFDVSTVLDSKTYDKQTVTNASELIDNDWVEFKKGAELKVTAGEALAGGVNSEVDGTAHKTFLEKLESKSVNAVGYAGSDEATKALYTAYVKRMRDEQGKKFQVVLFNYSADFEGVVNVKNGAELVYWVTGVVAGTAVNATALNKLYDGEYSVNVEYTQAELEDAIKAGEFTLHQVGDDVRVLSDVNSLVTTSDSKGDIFKDNQTIRVIDQIANDIAVLFNTKYLGAIPNDKAGRISLWSDIIKHHESLQNIKAIENFSDTDVVVSQGDSKKAVVVTDAVTIVNTMEKFYMTVTIQ